MAFYNNTDFIKALNEVKDPSLPIIFQDEYGTQCPPTHVDDSLDGLIEVNIDTFNPPLTAQALEVELSKDKAERGENYITAWDDDGSRMELQRIEETSNTIIVHVCEAKRVTK
ncbi:hypothetical protein [Vibrio alginolyticus]|uniref:hypothetical protein n=1 Tax=Vibrio alginolyticus TaxID=663 RepID=UPI0006CA9031|nr:hypothetical protein [Vibrio alginolyticus]KPM98463.1 hypothetical protein AOG25_08440 [Vibrio alginolyticus]CAH7232186.1 conserved hypothetical protein [Vibrio chagasii]